MLVFMAFPNRTQLPIYVTRNLKLMDTLWCEKIEKMGSMVASSVSFVLILNIYILFYPLHIRSSVMKSRNRPY